MSRAPSNSFSTTLDVRWSDQDLNGHVNNAQSITLMEEARVQAGITWTGTAPSTKTPRVVRALNTLFDDELTHGSVTAYVWISGIAATSYTDCHELSQDRTARVYGETVIVVLDPGTRKPAPLDAAFRARLEEYQALEN